MSRPTSNRKAHCHPDRPYKARNMCRACYNVWRYHHVPGAKESNQIRSRRRDHRKHNLQTRYGMPKERYESLLATQSGKCAICFAAPDKNLCVDHNHVSGQVRGLLCHLCNKGLGQFRDTRKFLLRALLYLEEHAA